MVHKGICFFEPIGQPILRGRLPIQFHGLLGNGVAGLPNRTEMGWAVDVGHVGILFSFPRLRHPYRFV